MSGSFDALVLSAIFKAGKGKHLVVLHDKEEAAYFQSDLSCFLSEDVISFPSSYKKPYQYEETENANILQRAETLNAVSERDSFIIVTHPEALSEKVINKRSLVSNTFIAKTGEQLDVDFLSELLHTYDFEKCDFVYEPGQFSIRGGIIDVFSFSNDNPYRIELFGDEIESLKEFDAESQLSIKTLNHISLVPDVQTKLLEEQRQSFLEFIPEDTSVWMKDYQQALDIVERSFQNVRDSFDEILSTIGESSLITAPEQLFESMFSFSKSLENFLRIEFGHRFHLGRRRRVVLPDEATTFFS